MWPVIPQHACHYSCCPVLSVSLEMTRWDQITRQIDLGRDTANKIWLQMAAGTVTVSSKMASQWLNCYKKSTAPTRSSYLVLVSVLGQEACFHRPLLFSVDSRRYTPPPSIIAHDAKGKGGNSSGRSDRLAVIQLPLSHQIELTFHQMTSLPLWNRPLKRTIVKWER